MKKLSAIVLSVMALFVAMSCARDTGESETVAEEQEVEVQELQDITLKGVAVGGAHASIIIEDSIGDEHEFSYPDLESAMRDSWEEGDSVEITFTKVEFNGNLLDSVISLRNLTSGDNK